MVRSAPRSGFVMCCEIACLIACVLSVVAGQTTGDWPVFGGNTAHTAFNPTTILKDFNPDLRWNVSLITGLTYATLFQDMYMVCGAGNLFLLDESSGKILQSVDVGAGSFMGPPIGALKDFIFVQTIGGNEGIYLQAFNTSGIQQWEVQGASQWAHYPYGVTPGSSSVYMSGGEYNGEMYSIGYGGTQIFDSLFNSNNACDDWAPTIYQGRVFFNNLNIFGEVNPATGRVLWSIPLNGAFLGYSTMWVPAITNHLAFVLTFSGGILELGAVDVNAHVSKWGFPCKQPSSSVGTSFYDYSPSTDGKMVYLTCGDGVHAFDVSKGTPLITYPCNNCGGQPIITNDAVIVGSSSGTLIFNKQTGKLVKSLPENGALAMDGNRLFITNSPAGTVVAYDLN